MSVRVKLFEVITENSFVSRTHELEPEIRNNVLSQPKLFGKVKAFISSSLLLR